MLVESLSIVDYMVEEIVVDTQDVLKLLKDRASA